MKKLILTCLFICPLLLTAAPLCTGTGGTPGSDSGAISRDVWAAAGFSCSIGDKTIGSFLPDDSPVDTSLRITVQTVGSATNYIVTFNGNFTSAFTVGYNIFIDPSIPGVVIPPGTFIAQVGLDENAPGIGATAQVVKTVRTGSQGGPIVGTLTVTPSAKPSPINTNATSLYVSDAYTGTGAVSFSNAFTQTAIPEPTSMMLIGTGLMLGSFLLRRRRV